MTAKYLSLVFCIVTLSFSQQSLLSKYASELAALPHHGITVDQTTPNRIILRQNNSIISVKNILPTETPRIGGANLTISPSDMDTMLFYSKYRFMAELPLGDYYVPNIYTVFDANKNGRNEIYGNRMRRTVGDPFSFEGLAGYEYGTDSIFKSILFIPDSIGGPSAFGDVDGDNLIDLAVFKVGPQYNFNYLYTQSTQTSYPITVKTQYDTLAHQLGAQMRSFIDIDGDEKDETVYKVVGSNVEELSGFPTVIDRYDTVSKTFKHWYYVNIKDPGEVLTYTKGLSFGDFDGDGKANIGTGSENGYAYTHEYQGNDLFTTKMIAQLPTKNLYLTCVTNDFNKNGKPEVWFGGDTFINDTAVTRLFAFESVGDDQYQQVYQIDIIGMFSFIGFGMHSRDMDNDGKDELFVHLAQRILIFKSNAQSGMNLWYVKINELAAAGQNSVIYSSDAADLDGDGQKEIILETDYDPVGFGIKKFTTIFKRTGVTEVKNKPTGPSGYQFSQNYPNPFNNQTNISFAIPKEQHVAVTIFNSLGKEIVILLNSTVQSGAHTIPWTGKSSSGEMITSGIYFIVIETNEFKKTIKAIYIK